jgi:beta-phosphoglucomutase-like phosphatase (HAD superfamily)
MIKAIIFDCFGVLTTDGWLPFKKRHFGDKPELHQQATDLNRQVDGGFISYDDFVAGVAGLAGVPLTEAKQDIENNVANEPLFNLIKTLKPKYKIGFLSNAGSNWISTLFSPEQAAMFDAISVSSETGFVKPEEQAYLEVAEKLNVTPAECVFVDDQLRYCEAAKEVGMQAIEYRDFDQFQSELDTLLTEK